MKHGDYPQAYREMFETTLKHRVTMAFSTKEKAVAFRSELCKYRYAVRDDLPRSKALYNLVMKVKMSINGESLSLQQKKSQFVEKLNER